MPLNDYRLQFLLFYAQVPAVRGKQRNVKWMVFISF